MRIFRNLHTAGWSIIIGDDGTRSVGCPPSGLTIHFTWCIIPTYVRFNLKIKNSIYGFGGEMWKYDL
jgi:hypothetical protein